MQRYLKTLNTLSDKERATRNIQRLYCGHLHMDFYFQFKTAKNSKIGRIFMYYIEVYDVTFHHNAERCLK